MTCVRVDWIHTAYSVDFMMYTDAKPQINEEGSLRRRYKVLLLLFCTCSILLEHLDMYVRLIVHVFNVPVTGAGVVLKSVLHEHTQVPQFVVRYTPSANTGACVLHVHNKLQQ